MPEHDFIFSEDIANILIDFFFKKQLILRGKKVPNVINSFQFHNQVFRVFSSIHFGTRYSSFNQFKVNFGIFNESSPGAIY